MHPKYQSLRKFTLLLSVLLAYFAYLSWKFDLETGGIVSVLTWSFFVLCTPIADAGFLLDFPVRLITGIRMFLTEILVWVIAIGQNVLCLHLAPQHYQITYLTRLLHQVLTTPWPYWTIIV